MVTGDEKWVVYNNLKRKRAWYKKYEPAQTTSKPDIHQNKNMLYVWWDFKGIVYFGLFLQDNTPINSDVSCNQLAKSSDALKEKRQVLVNRKAVVLHPIQV